MSSPHRIGRFAGPFLALALASATALAQPAPKQPSGPGGPGAPGVPPSTPAGTPAPPSTPPRVVPPAGAPGTPADPGTAAIHTGALATGDRQLESGEYYDEFTLQVAAGEEIIAAVMALDFDPYLIAISPSGDQRDNDDFAGSRDVSLLEFPVDQPGAWTIRVTTYEPGETGAYSFVGATREADGEDAGEEVYEEESPDDFTIDGPITFGQTIRGTLNAEDETRNDGSYYEAYTLEAPAGARVTIQMESKDFDTYLTLFSPSGEMESNDDGIEGTTNSKIEKTVEEAGRWIVVANTLGAEEAGDFRLTVTRN